MNSLKSCYFTTSKGHSYIIVKTDYGTGKEVENAIDTIVNSQGKRKKNEKASYY